MKFRSLYRNLEAQESETAIVSDPICAQDQSGGFPGSQVRPPCMCWIPMCCRYDLSCLSPERKAVCQVTQHGYHNLLTADVEEELFFLTCFQISFQWLLLAKSQGLRILSITHCGFYPVIWRMLKGMMLRLPWAQSCTLAIFTAFPLS